MNRMVLAAACVFASSMYAVNQPAVEKKEVVTEHKALSGLKAAGAAVGAGTALYIIYALRPETIKGFQEACRKPDLHNLHVSAIRIATLAHLAYSTYKLGYEALPSYVHRVLDK